MRSISPPSRPRRNGATVECTTAASDSLRGYDSPIPTWPLAPWLPNWTWIRVHSESGHVGIGESYPRNESEAAVVHSTVAPFLLGRDGGDIDRIWADLYRTFDFQVTGGTEMRVLSAINLALWDLLGKALGVPVYRLIGGKSNPKIRVYNTCFGLRYDFNKEPEKIMREVLDRYGVKSIKIWPFDEAARRNQHQYVTHADIDEGLAPVRKLRAASSKGHIFI